MIRYRIPGLLLASYLALSDGQFPVCAQQPAGGRGVARVDADDATLAGDEARIEGRTIAEWVSDWDENKFDKNQAAIRALAAGGEPAADAMAKLIKERHRHAGMAIQTLGKMGEPARVALPVMVELAANKKVTNPEGWTWNVSLRTLLLTEAKNMPWASGAWIPVLQRVAEDNSEDEYNRLRAIDALGRMGTAATPILKEFAANENNAVRKSANEALAGAAVAAGRSKAEVYEEIIARNPFDANVPEYLIRTQDRYNNGSPNPLTQRVKAQLRQRLAEKPNAEVAYSLATIIRNGLANTDLEFAAPSDSYRNQSDREDPAESYATMAAALVIGLENAPKDSELAGRSGRSLARLRLLQGDWAGMNAALEKIGQQPVPADLRANLPAPPLDWTNLQKDWQPADAAMRTGKAAIELQFEKDGKGLAGAHVLIKKVPPPEQARYLGIRADTLLLATQPLEAPPYDGFGYRAADRAMTRYAVSDAGGKIRIEGLPAIPIVVEVLIPTSNFPEPGKNWDLLMETVPGEFHPTWMEASGTRGGARGQARNDAIDARPRLPSVSRRDGPAVVTLKDDETHIYPKFVVRPQLSLNVADFSPVNASDFVLEWQSLSKSEPTLDHYEVEMMLTAPQQTPSHLPSQRVIRSTSVEAFDSQWPVGKEGVGGQRLVAGNINMFEVRAIDREGKVLARLPRTRVWVPWAHRESQPPDHKAGAISDVPFYDQMWWNTGSQTAGGRRIDAREKIAQFLVSSTDRFELEYVQLGSAWLQCLDGDVPTGRKELERLAAALPEGNVVRGTARSLLKMLDGGQQLPKRLEFVADE
jgi:hypothetical protein